MRSDIRMTPMYREIAEYCRDVRQPGSGQISDCAQLHASPDREYVVFAATLAEKAEEEPPTRLALVELATGTISVITSGPSSDKLPKFSIDGKHIAFLSDRQEINGYQLYILDRTSNILRTTPTIAGSVEYLQWSADETKVLLGVVGPMSASDSTAGKLSSWMPSIAPTDQHDHWRSCWIYELATDTVRRIATDEGSVWEASWCGNGALATVTSDRPDEGCWFSASLRILDVGTGKHREIYAPSNQLGTPVVAPSGEKIAIVEGLCSDRGLVLGDLMVVDAGSGLAYKANTRDVDVATVEWQSDRHLLISGARGLGAVLGLYDVATSVFSEIWSSKDVGIAAACVVGLERPGDCVVIVESFTQAPQLVLIRAGQCRQIKSFDIGYAAATGALAAVERITWPSVEDGLTIEGWLLRPHGPPPYPLILNIHGGPVQYWRPAFLIRKLLHVPILLKRGFAMFLPNPRGSSGRGQQFSQRVLGDLGGADALDLLSGLDVLIADGVAAPGQIGVTGVSYGGFMTAWLITQSDRFAAAVAVSPHTNQVTAQLLSNVAPFMSRLLNDDIGDPGGRYVTRSPSLQVRTALVPTLTIAGALDRCTPPEEAVQFHAALIETGTRSVLVSYPEAGHGIRRLPAAIDCAARICDWFMEHMSA